MPYQNLLLDRTYLVNEKTGMYEGAETIIIWEFEFQRNAQSLINSWLLPFIILMFASNLVFVISESGIYPCILQF